MAYLASTTINGITITATPSSSGTWYDITDSSGAKIASAGSAFGVANALGSLATKANDSGNSELSTALRNAQSQMASGGAEQLAQEVRDQIKAAKPQVPVEPKKEETAPATEGESAGSTPKTPDPDPNAGTGVVVNPVPDAAQNSTVVDDSNGNRTVTPNTTAPGDVLGNPDGPSRDELNNLMPGWSYDPVEGDYYTGMRPKKEEKPASKKPPQPTKPDKDWRFRISLAPSASYLYNIPYSDLKGTILEPLHFTNGVVFPYTPSIMMNYQASYEPYDLLHSNYKFYQYKSSEVGAITISADFTAQDTAEANYVLAMMHFFKTVTKMFYGQDLNPPAGLPPPLCYLHGYGPYQFDNHPVVIQSFSFTLPNDVDYIRAYSKKTMAESLGAPTELKSAVYNPGIDRLKSSSLNKGGVVAAPAFKSLSTDEATNVPTKMTISLTCLPVMSRDDVSKNFSLREYAKGTIYPGSKNKSGGGFW
jgi:hypothetical protein